MSFPDFDSLKAAAKVHQFREPAPDETEAEYRSSLADYVAQRDLIESQEIRSGKGRDQWDARDNLDLFVRVLDTLKQRGRFA